MRRARHVGVLVAAVLLTAGARAHAEPDPLTGTSADQGAFFGPAEFLEKSYLFYSFPPPSPNPTSFGPEGQRDPTDAWLILEAQPAIHFYFFNELSELIRYGNLKGRRWTFAPSFTLQMQIRFLNTTSSPVRTPSFMPRLNFQVFRMAFNQLGAKYLEIEIVGHLGHHSDGQEYCAFAAGHVDEGCPAFDTANPDFSQTNLVNGSFGTNYVSLGTHWKWVTEVDINDYARTSWTAGLLGEYNPKDFGPGALESPHDKLYGQTRLRVDGEFQRLTDLIAFGHRAPWAVGHARVAFMYQQIFGTGPGVAPYQVWLEASRTFLRVGGVGVFARLFSGQDYYNINYVNRIDYQFHAGLIIDFATPLQFGKSQHTEWHENDPL